MLNFTKPSHLLLSLFSIIFIGFSLLFIGAAGNIDTWGVNKTIGWAYDYCSLMPLFVFAAIVLGCITYGILALSKRLVNKVISSIHLMLLVALTVSFMFDVSYGGCDAVLMLAVLSLLILVSNVIFAIIKTRHK